MSTVPLLRASAEMRAYLIEQLNHVLRRPGPSWLAWLATAAMDCTAGCACDSDLLCLPPGCPMRARREAAER